VLGENTLSNKYFCPCGDNNNEPLNRCFPNNKERPLCPPKKCFFIFSLSFSPPLSYNDPFFVHHRFGSCFFHPSLLLSPLSLRLPLSIGPASPFSVFPSGPPVRSLSKRNLPVLLFTSSTQLPHVSFQLASPGWDCSFSPRQKSLVPSFFLSTQASGPSVPNTS